MASYLITGGVGFIGSHVVEELLCRGEKVRILDNFSSGREENLRPFRSRIELVKGDIRDISACTRAVKNVEYIIHLAAMTSVPGSVADPVMCNAVNITGTLNVLTAARNEGVKRLVFASSSAVYGEVSRLPNMEDTIGAPLSPYALSKRTGEIYCQMFTRLYGFNTVCLRYFNVFGPRQDPKSQYAAVIPVFITRMLEGKRPVIYGDGEQTRDFSYVRNIVQANISALHSEDAAAEVMNIAGGGRVSINDLVRIIGRILELDMVPKYAPPRPGDIEHSYACMDKAEEKMGFRPCVEFEDGLRLTIQWYRAGREMDGNSERQVT